jgi:tetratricopeptide (TPR) repeat protein
VRERTTEINDEVRAWVEKITIPTYETGKPDKNPMFLEKRVYQGSRGTVYPHPVIDKIADVKTDKEYTAVFIENRFLKIMVLPQLGGRIHRAYDKIRQRDFIYYNQVIKPALVGLTGPWISGGIEFNWPQHHRPSTFEPVDFKIEENADGSKTVWVNEVELMTRTKGMAGFTLYPGRAYVEVSGKLFNRTPFPQSFLWWANPAVKVNDDYQSVFPSDVNAVFDHGKRDVSDFPIATGTYYKVDYSPGTDISRYKNIPVPTSYMAIKSEYNFIGGYENDTHAGMLHVADHHFSPGKKQWTWGKGDFGIAWDRNLTDDDGPYIELMCGVYTDNQPDFSWLQPNEEKTFEQYFMPYSAIGIVKNATKEAAVNLEVNGENVLIKVYATAEYPSSVISVRNGKNIISEVIFDLSPESIYEGSVELKTSSREAEVSVEVLNNTGRVLVSFHLKKSVKTAIPKPAAAADLPASIPSNELLYLTGLHLEQYRHATYNPTDYYLEAIKRDHGDSRCNNAMGLYLLRRGQFEKARHYFETALETLVQRNPNPYDGEPGYNLGICLTMLEKQNEAYDCFYKSAWNDAWQHNGYFQLARIASRNGEFEQALYLINKSLVRNYHSHSARHLKVGILRKLGRDEEALKWIDDSLVLDPFNYGCLFERSILLKGNYIEDMKALMHGSFNNYTEYSLDYTHAGMYDEAYQLMIEYKNENPILDANPLMNYYMGWIKLKMNDEETALTHFRDAAGSNPEYCFPSKTEEVIILQAAIKMNSEDPMAHYLLGNYWYANQQYDDAIHCWERSIEIDNSFPTVHRNLSLAYYNKLHDPKSSVTAIETAFTLDTNDARVLMELNQLYRILNYSPWERQQLLEDHLTLVEQRDDLYLERVMLYNQLGDFETALALLSERKFHPWEGGEGKVVGQYLLCIIELSKNAISLKNYEEALLLLSKAEKYPHNLGEGKLAGVRENDIHYLQGLSYEGLGLKTEAENKYAAATAGISEPAQAIFYNDSQPDKIFYQGLAWMRLGNFKKAEQIFNRLIEFGQEHFNDEIRIDYFAVSLPDLLVFDQDLNLKNKIHCQYLSGLGNLGLGNKEEALKYFQQVLDNDRSHQGAIVHINMV